MNRRRFDQQGYIVATLGDYPEAVRQVAAEEKTVLIDLNAMSKVLFETLGPENSAKAFVHYPANTFPGQTRELKDDTHFNAYGGYELARCMVESIRTAIPELGQFVLDEVKRFDPHRPDPLGSFHLPLSLTRSAEKPAGN